MMRGSIVVTSKDLIATMTIPSISPQVPVVDHVTVDLDPACITSFHICRLTYVDTPVSSGVSIGNGLQTHIPWVEMAYCSQHAIDRQSRVIAGIDEIDLRRLQLTQ